MVNPSERGFSSNWMGLPGWQDKGKLKKKGINLEKKVYVPSSVTDRGMKRTGVEG